MNILKKSVPLWTLLLTIIVAVGAIAPLLYTLYEVSITIKPTPKPVVTPLSVSLEVTAGIPFESEPTTNTFATFIPYTISFSVDGLEATEKAYFDYLNASVQVRDVSLKVVWSGTIDVLTGTVTPDEGYNHPFELAAGVYGTSTIVSGFIPPSYELTASADFSIGITFA